MRDLSGRLDRLAEFVAEGRIDVRYALERAVALAREESHAVNTASLVDIASVAREREQSRCARIVGDVAERFCSTESQQERLSTYVRPDDMSREILRAFRTSRDPEGYILAPLSDDAVPEWNTGHTAEDLPVDNVNGNP